MKLSPNTNPPTPADLLIRMHNQVGAAVDVTGTPFVRASRWLCHGCGERSYMPEVDNLDRTRQSANAHAADCRGSHHYLR